MLKEFVSKIKSNSKIAIYGAGLSGVGLKKYIEENRQDIEILFYVDSFKTGEEDGLKIVNLGELEQYKNSIDLLIVATTRDFYELEVLFEYLEIPYLGISREIEQYYRTREYESKQKQALNVFKNEEDRKLYQLVWDWRNAKNRDELLGYVRENHGLIRYGQPGNYNKHYLEYINKNAIKTIFDAGVCNGAQFFAFKKHFPNLEHIYGFEPMYEEFKKVHYDQFIQKMPEVEIVPLALWSATEKLSFIEKSSWQSASHVKGVADYKVSFADDNVVTIQATSIDDFKKANNIEKVDFIKMDIEGSEPNALKGAINTINSDRPQLAVSIYHGLGDFVNIPLYLNEVLTDYTLRLGHYSCSHLETVLYAIPNELM